jgi:hypothetical protein
MSTSVNLLLVNPRFEHLVLSSFLLLIILLG